MRKLLGYAGLVIAAVLIAYYLLPGKENSLGSSTDYSSVNVSPTSSTGDTYAYAVNGTTVVNTSGVWVGTVSSTASTFTSLTIGGGTAITGYKCASATYTVPALSPYSGTGTAQATTSLALAGAVTGDQVTVSYVPTSATGTLTGNGIMAFGEISATATGTVAFFNTSAATSTAIGGGTLKACYTH